MEQYAVVTLVSIVNTTNEIGENVALETLSDVYGQITSISSTEWFTAQRDGINCRYRVLVHSFEYDNQQYVIIKGTRYKVYRTYDNDDDMVELYLEERVGAK